MMMDIHLLIPKQTFETGCYFFWKILQCSK